MSIIYDAIKKVEERRFMDSSLSQPLRKERKNAPVLIFVFIFAAGIISVTFMRFTKLKKTEVIPTASLSPASIPPAPVDEPPAAVIEPQSAVVKPVQPIQEEEQKPPVIEEKLVLNGIFFSENEGYALISDKIVKKGDAVNKAIVKRIDVDTVELELENGSSISLSTTR